MRFYNDKEKRVFTPEEFNEAMQEKYGISNFRGQEFINNSRDNAAGDVNQTSLAYQYATDRLTYIRTRYVEQSFYEVPPADFFDVLIGEGAFSAQIITQMAFKSGGNFTAGKLNTANANSKLNVADAAVTPIYTKVMNWGLATEYNIFDVNMALFAGTWDPVEAKQKARKKLFDLGLQYVMFLGDISDNTNFPGLLTQPTITANQSRISQAISTFSTTQFATFVAGLIGDYVANAVYTTFPNKFTIPTDDWTGLATPVSQTFPTIMMIEYLQKAFNAICTKGIELIPLAYGVPANNLAAINAPTGKHIYALYHEDIDTLFAELPVNYTVTQVGTYNNFSFQDVAYAQYSGVTLLKPLEMMYFTY